VELAGLDLRPGS